MNKRLRISILVDSPCVWMLPFAKNLRAKLLKKHYAGLYFKPSDVPRGDMLFLLGCTSIIPGNILKRNKHNFVIHESDLPEGRGWSPLGWQVLKGKNKIPIVLFAATERPDAGPVYLKDYIKLNGTELLSELRQKQGEKTVELAVRLLKKWPHVKAVPQRGTSTYYRKRAAADDALDPKKSIIRNFNHLRIVDNEKYPAWFEFKGEKYVLKIYKGRKIPQ